MRCDSPFLVKEHSYGDDPIPVPCGNCPYCVHRRINEMSFRLMQEELYSQWSYFITLTYSPEHLPRSKRGFKSLKKKDLQNFFKRLRYYHKRKKYYTDEIKLGYHKQGLDPIKYYACGEYGEKTKRPHYHALIFNAHRLDIERSWDLGTIHFGQVTPQSCRYTLKYMSKGVRKPFPWPFDGEDQTHFISQGIGLYYLTPQIVAWHRADPLRNYVVWPGGYKCSLPKYYARQIWDTDELKQRAYDIQDVLEQEFAKKMQKDPNFQKKEYIRRQGRANNFKRNISKEKI